jgi:hypothetical protein
MKLHKTLVDILLKTYEVNSGWTEERKLREALQRLDISVYTQQDGTQILVSTQQLHEAQKQVELELERNRGK